MSKHATDLKTIKLRVVTFEVFLIFVMNVGKCVLIFGQLCLKMIFNQQSRTKFASTTNIFYFNECLKILYVFALHCVESIPNFTQRFFNEKLEALERTFQFYFGKRGILQDGLTSHIFRPELVPSFLHYICRFDIQQHFFSFSLEFLPLRAFYGLF